MATRKTISKAKPKTTARASARTTKKTTTAKAATKTTTTRVVRKSGDVKAGLKRLNVLSALVGVAAAVAAALLMNHATYQLFTGLVTRNPLTGGMAPAVHSVYDVELRWVVVVILGLSALIPLLAATRNRRKYEATLDNKVMLWRWIDLGVISALMVEVIALLSGVQDIMVLKLLAGFMVVTCLLGWMAERQNAGAARPFWGTYALSLLTGVMPWLLIAVYAIGTPVWGMVRSPWYVYALYATTLVAFTGIALSLRGYISGRRNYALTERRYQLFGLFGKLAFAVILIIGFKK